ncbi:hypothetical protein [Oscillatoria sp. FACHB-1406]|uniref:hypothetical protein n=1 Tax=Oscillatoria sp. FACHB-1406 TaxID=2692846 RepID=UPI0016886E10|nr:hypothetical protein [Oscillatoria sp. FACHB-1406]MBD2579237.1 hypothetical protein [Oscillatoria sp. FACHB-1406]
MLKQRRMGTLLLAALVGLVIAIASTQVPASAQIDLVTIQEILDSDRVFIEQNPAKVNDTASFKQTVSTQEARASLAFNNGSVGRMGPNSKITIGQCIEVKEGLLLASGPANGCAANFEVAVQGTVYVLEVDKQGQSSVKVLEGEVQVNKTGSSEKLAIAQGKRLDISPDGFFSQLFDLSQADIENLLQGSLFNGFQIPIPGAGKLQEALQSLYPNINLPRLPGFNLPGLPGGFPGLPF